MCYDTVIKAGVKCYDMSYTLGSCTGGLDSTGGACNCCMAFNSVNGPGVCTTKDPILGSSNVSASIKTWTSFEGKQWVSAIGLAVMMAVIL